jgi:replicative DNA helicase
VELASDPNVEPAKAALDSSSALAQLGAAGTAKIRTFSDTMVTLLDQMDAVRKGTYQHYIKTGIAIWDNLLAGVARGIVTIVAAYPGVGKGAVVGRMLINLAQMERKSILFSLEDPEYWLAKRYTADASGIPVRALMQADRTSDIRDQYVEQAVMDAQRWGDNMLIDDRSNLTVDQISATARQAIVQHGVEVIVIDNASEVSLEGDERHDIRSANMVRALRDVAKAHNVAVVLLMHLKKNGNTAKEGAYIRPTSELLKNTASFAEVARAIVALWRNEEHRDEIVATILKQTEGERDIDFTMKFNASAGLVESFGGSKVETDKGYTDAKPNPTREALFGRKAS